MSFGFSVVDAVSLGHLAWRTVQNSRKACGEHDELTLEASSLHVVIRRLEKEMSKPESPINRPGDKCREELQSIVDGCEKVLRLLNRVLEKYNTLSEKERSARKLWHKVRFGNGELADTRDLKEKLIYYTSALSLFVNMVSMGSIGRVEQQMDAAGGHIREIRMAVNGITAHLLAASRREGSVLTTYGDDDKGVWKEFRKELIEEGFSSATIRKHKHLVKAYIKELGDRGVLDDDDPHSTEETSDLADTDLNHHAAPPTGLHDLRNAASTAPSKTRSVNSEPPPIHVSNHRSDIDTLRTATLQNASEMNERDILLFKSRADPSGFKIVKLQSHNAASEYIDPFPPRYRDFTYWKPMWKECFRDSLRDFIECFPFVWIFHAREDIDDVHIYVGESVSNQIDRGELQYVATSALAILSKLEPWSGLPPGSARILVDCVEVFSGQGYRSQNSRWTELEGLISFDSTSPRRLPDSLNERDWYDINTIIDNDIEQWVKHFNNGFYESVVRLRRIWAQVARLITDSNYDGTKSLALFFTSDEGSSEPQPQSQEEIEKLQQVGPPSMNSSNSSPYQVVFDDREDPKGKPESHDRNDLASIWQDRYISSILPRCEEYLSQPPSGKLLELEHTRLSESIFLQVIMQLDAVGLKGNQALRQQRKDMVDQAQEMLSRLDKVKAAK